MGNLDNTGYFFETDETITEACSIFDNIEDVDVQAGCYSLDILNRSIRMPLLERKPDLFEKSVKAVINATKHEDFIVRTNATFYLIQIAQREAALRGEDELYSIEQGGLLVLSGMRDEVLKRLEEIEISQDSRNAPSL